MQPPLRLRDGHRIVCPGIMIEADTPVSRGLKRSGDGLGLLVALGHVGQVSFLDLALVLLE